MITSISPAPKASLSGPHAYPPPFRRRAAIRLRLNSVSLHGASRGPTPFLLAGGLLLLLRKTVHCISRGPMPAALNPHVDQVEIFGLQRLPQFLDVILDKRAGLMGFSKNMRLQLVSLEV